jgi:hypothetical protein
MRPREVKADTDAEQMAACDMTAAESSVLARTSEAAYRRGVQQAISMLVDDADAAGWSDEDLGHAFRLLEEIVTEMRFSRRNYDLYMHEATGRVHRLIARRRRAPR